MPIAVSRALAFTAGVSLLILLALGGQAQAKKSTKTVNAKSTLTSLVKQTQSLPRQAASRSAKAKLLRRARHARTVASKTPCTAVKDLSAYRKTLRATKISGAVKGKAARNRLAKRLAALGPASAKASRKLLSDRRTKSCGGGVVTPTSKTVKTSVKSSDVNGMTIGVDLPAVQFVEKSEGGKSWTQLVLPNTGLVGRARHARHPRLVEHDRHPGRREARGQARRRRSPTRSTTSSSSRPSPSRPTSRPAAPDAEAELRRGRVLRPALQVRRQGLRDRRARPRGAGVRQGSSARPATSTSRGLHFPAAQYNPKTDKLQVLTHVDVKVTFEGGPHTFPTRSARRGRPRRTGSPAACSTRASSASSSRRSSTSRAARSCSSSRTRRRSRRRTRTRRRAAPPAS